MERSRSLAVLEREAGRVLALAEVAAGAGTGDRPVTTCPGWTLDDVPNHLGRVYAMVATVLEGDPSSPPDRAVIPSRPDEQEPAAWMRERLDILLPLLRGMPDDAVRWNFNSGPASPVSFWWRRQVHETLVHRVDIELAAGEPVTSPEPDIAGDGVAELLLLTGHRRVERDEIRLGEAMTVHLHATDLQEGVEWTVDTVHRTYAAAHLKADVAVRGPAWALDRWCWRRPVEGDELEILGDRPAAEDWRPTI